MAFTHIDQHFTTAAGTRAERADIGAAQQLAHYRHYEAVWALGRLSQAGDQGPLLMLSGVMLVYGLASGKAHRIGAGGRMLAAVLVAAGIKTGLKRLVSRTRPNVLLDEGRYAVRTLGPNDGPMQSFPSGHTAGAVAAARVLARAYPGVRGPAYVAAGVIALTQVLRGSHFPSDVAAGVLIGIAAETAVARVAGVAEPGSVSAQARR
jgi:membrane-associated phospholipid phosphatase